MREQRSEPWSLLAGVRFGLAAIVMCRHFDYLHLPRGIISHYADLCACSAVLCFLVISGYSIAHSVARRSNGFYKRRLLRIYPLYALAVLAALVTDFVHGSPANSHVVLANLAFQQTFRYPVVNGNPVLWSVAVEAAFYALTPLLKKLPTSALLGMTAASVLAYLVYPFIGLPYFAWLHHGEAMLFLGWAWLAGFIYYRFRDIEWAGMLLVCGMVLVTSVNAMYTYKYHEVTNVVAMVAIVAGGSLRIPVLFGKVLSYLGDLSFPLYLFHAPVMFVYVDGLHHHNPWILIASCLVFSALMLVVDAWLRRPVAFVADTMTATGQTVLTTVVAGARTVGAEFAEFNRPIVARFLAFVSGPLSLASRPVLTPYSNVALAVGLAAIATAAAVTA